MKNNYFEFYDKVQQQILGIAIGTIFAPQDEFTEMDKTETNFINTRNHQLFVWFRYIDKVFFNWTYKENLF